MTIDDVLRDRLTEAADRSGSTADPDAASAILGDAVTGTGTAAGGAGASGSVWPILGLGVAGLALGTILGATALRGGGDDSPPVDGGDGVAMVADGGGPTLDLASYATYDCPDRAVTDRSLHAGDRVLVVGRDDGGTWVAVRDPAQLGRTLWLPLSAVEPDAALDVEVIECDEPASVGSVTPATTLPEVSTTSTTSVPPTSTTSPTTSTTVVESSTTVGVTTAPPGTPPPATTPPATAPPSTAPPTPPGTPPPTSPPSTSPPSTAPPTTAPPTTPPPTPPPDTQAPNIGQASASPGVVYVQPCPGADLTATVSVIASDDRGVASVTGTHALGSFSLSGPSGGGTWTGTFGPFSSAAGSPQVTITLTARDAAGNAASTTTSVTVFTCPF